MPSDFLSHVIFSLFSFYLPGTGYRSKSWPARARLIIGDNRNKQVLSLCHEPFPSVFFIRLRGGGGKENFLLDDQVACVVQRDNNQPTNPSVRARKSIGPDNPSAFFYSGTGHPHEQTNETPPFHTSFFLFNSRRVVTTCDKTQKKKKILYRLSSLFTWSYIPPVNIRLGNNIKNKQLEINLTRHAGTYNTRKSINSQIDNQPKNLVLIYSNKSFK